MESVTRWEPNARERLEKAAMELYRERGFDETTVAEIAERAGLTERTFFRYFSDKREVLFWGAGALQDLLTEKVGGAPDGSAPLDVVVTALESTSEMFEQRREFAGHRQALIAAHPELLERELVKLASLAMAIAEALRRRGVTDPAASLAGEAGIAVFRLGFQSWVADPKRGPLSQHIRASLRSLKAVTAGESPPTKKATRGRRVAPREARRKGSA